MLSPNQTRTVVMLEQHPSCFKIPRKNNVYLEITRFANEGLTFRLHPRNYISLSVRLAILLIGSVLLERAMRRSISDRAINDRNCININEKSYLIAVAIAVCVLHDSTRNAIRFGATR